MIKGLFNLIFGVIRLAIVLAIFIAIFHTWVIQQALTYSISYQLGADVSIRQVKMDWKNTGFEVRDLEIGNPYSFPKEVLADIPLAIVSIDMPSLTQGRGLRIKTLAFDLRELRVMNIPQKGLNILALKPLQNSENEKSSSQTAVRRQVDKYAPPLTVDELIISLGDILYINMSGPTMQQRKFHAGIRGATYYDIRGSEDIIGIIANEALKRIGLGYLNAKLQKFQDRVAPSNSFLGKAFDALKEELSK